MAITVEFAWNDRSGSDTAESSTRTLNFIVSGTDDYDDARQAVYDLTPSSDAGLVRTSVSELKRAGYGSWTVAVGYAPYVGGLPDPTSIEFPGPDAEFHFETGGGTRNLKIAYGRSVTRPAGNGADPGIGNYINATSDGVAGVDIESSVFNFTITKALQSWQIGGSYVGLLFSSTKTWNETPVTINVANIVLPFQAGELLFRGASGGISYTDGIWRLTYNFSALENRLINTIENINPFYVKGWDYLEIRTELADAGDTVKILKPVVTAAIVHQVFKSSNHNNLGI